MNDRLKPREHHLHKGLNQYVLQEIRCFKKQSIVWPPMQFLKHNSNP